MILTIIDDIIAEIVERSERGEEVNREDYLTRFPEHANALREFFKGFDRVNLLTDVPNQARLRNAGATGEHLAMNDGRANENPLAGFEIVKELHRGAQGAVYQAVPRSTDREVALKVLHGCAACSFKHEARLIARLGHPNVVTVYEAGITEGRPYCAMELVEGAPLDRFLSEHTLDTKAKLRLFVKVCAGVMHAHRRGVIHRDLKPSNILVEPDGEPRVLDFGLAKHVGIDRAEAEASPEFDGAFVGTLAYASPEQIASRDDEIDTRSDVYALGVILYEMLTGRRPYSVPEDRRGALEVITGAEPERPSTKCRGLDDDVDCIVRKAMAKDSAARYQSLELLIAEIDQYLSGRPIEQKRDRLGYVVRRVASRQRRAFAASVALVFALGAFSAVFISRLADEQVAADATALVRFKAARLADLYMLREHHQASVASANRLQEVAYLPPDRIEPYMARYQSPPIEPDGVFEPLVEVMPQKLVDAIRSSEGPEYEEATRWLEEVTPRLDSLAASLESESFLFSVGAVSNQALGWDYVAVREAARTCEALVGRAYQRHAAKDHHGAIADIRAATLLATDIGDGVLCQHKMYCYHCQGQILGFLQVALTESIEDNEAVELYVEQALAHPPLPLASVSVLPTRMGMQELLHLALVAESMRTDERIDLVRLDGFMGGFLEAQGVLTDENVARLAEYEVQDFNALMDRYITCAQTWNALTAFEIRERVDVLTEALLHERETNPLLWFFSLPGNEFLMRLRTCSQRQALRLAAAASRYQAERGQWPEDLADALPPDAAEDTIDPRTGQAFVYDVAADLPRIRSVCTDDLRGRLGPHAIAWAAEGDDLVTYFPSRTPHH